MILNIDFHHLCDNENAGNINDAYSRDDGIYRFYLVDGYIEIQASKCTIKATDI